MKNTYFDDDDTLVIRLSDKPIVREVSQDWHTHIAYAADGTVVETTMVCRTSSRLCGIDNVQSNWMRSLDPWRLIHPERKPSL